MRIVLDLQGAQAKSRLRGIGRYSHALALAMARNAGPQHELWLALNGNLPEALTALKEDFRGLIPDERIKLFTIPAPVAESVPANAWRTRAAEYIRETFLTSLAPDLVHISSLFEGWVDDAVTSIGQLAATPPTAVTLYDLIPLLNPKRYLEPNHLFRSAYLRKVQALKRAELLLAISESARNEALEAIAIPPERVVNIGAGIDERFRTLDLHHDDGSVLKRYGLTRPFIMYTGGIDPRKNIEGLISAYGLLPGEMRKNLQLAVVCTIQDADRQRLLSLARQQGVTEQELRFTGYVDDEELVYLYNVCTLFVFPSFHEGFGLPALEAMACGAPVIGADASSIPEVIGRSDALFDPAHPRAIAEKIVEVLDNPAFRQSLREHGFQQARAFTWDLSAKKALEAFDAVHACRQAAQRTTVALPHRPRMAYLSPLPPQQTGIADYSAELIPELARHYDITLITEQPAVVDSPWLTANFPIHSPEWFAARATGFDRIIYQLGNSSFHAWQLPLLARHPGIVVLHDFFLGGLYSWLAGTGTIPGAFQQALFHSHGLTPFLYEARHGQEQLPWIYPCNLEPLEQALGIIAHSDFVRSQAAEWYGDSSGQGIARIGHLRLMPCNHNRATARTALGIATDERVICSFGLLGPTKLNHRLLDAWQTSSLAADPRYRLVFVGEPPENAYGKELQKRLSEPAAARVTVTGFVDQTTYRHWLAAADLAVQLRNRTRGETSGTVLDCLAYGIPTIINAHGSLAELPDDVTLKLPDSFNDSQLRQALEQLAADTGRCSTLSAAATMYISRQHHPATIGRQYRHQIELFMQQGAPAARQRLLDALATMESRIKPDNQDLAAAATAVSHNENWSGPRQLLLDISELAQRDAKSGIQRVVRNILEELISHPPKGYRIEPVCDNGQGGYSYARQHTARLLGFSAPSAIDGPVEVWPGDLFLGLDLHPRGIPQLVPYVQNWRQRGVRICFVVYDLLPILRPDCFIDGADQFFGTWLHSAAQLADKLICISGAVAHELRAWLSDVALPRPDLPAVGFFHLGSELPPMVLHGQLQGQEQQLVDYCQQQPSFLMVGTIEPRKAHAQALAAMELLWRQGISANLIIIGKQGWLVDKLIEQIKNHPEQGKRLIWLEGANDHLLEQLYKRSAALLNPSEGEGFGLPLVEAARHGLPILARDIPVFREVAGEHAWYFSGTTAEELAHALQGWLKASALKKVPSSSGIPIKTWAQSAAWLVESILPQQHNSDPD